MNLLYQVGLLFGLSGFFGFIATATGIPLVAAYLAAGLAVGPLGLKVLDLQSPSIEGLTSIGIAFMLFIVGLELDVKAIRKLGMSLVRLSANQVVITMVISLILALLLSYSGISAWYIAVSLAFSSTIIGVKLLSDRSQINSLHGRYIIGLLLIQDLLAIVVLVIFQSIQQSNQGILGFWFKLGLTLLNIAIFTGVAYILRKYVIRNLFKLFSRSLELLFVSSIGWALVLSWVAMKLGFPLVIGAFIAGVTLAPLDSAIEIRGRIRWLRDFFLVIFLALIGANLTKSYSVHLVIPTILIIITVCVLKPLIIMSLMALEGFRSRTSFLTSVYLSHISEFSLILVSLGLQSHKIGPELASLIAVGTLSSMAISSIVISKVDALYNKFHKLIKLFERKGHFEEDLTRLSEELEGHVIVFGADRIGKPVLDKLQKLGHQVLVVDFDPNIIEQLRATSLNAIYGDMGDPELVNHLNLEKAKMIISTAHDFADSKAILKKVKSVSGRQITFVTANNPDEALELYKLNADYVILPYHLSGEFLADIISDVKESAPKTSLDKIEFRKNAHILELSKIVN